MNIAPSLMVLKERLLLEEDYLHRAIVLVPILFGFSLESNMLSRLDFFQKGLDLPDNYLCGCAVCSEILSYSYLEMKYKTGLKTCW